MLESQSRGAGRASGGLLCSPGPGRKGLAPAPFGEVSLRSPSLLPPGLHAPCLCISWRKSRKGHTRHSCFPPSSRRPALLRGYAQGGPESVSFFPGPAAPSSWGCGEKGPDRVVDLIWATPLPSELCLQLQEGESKKQSQAEQKLARPRGLLARDTSSLTRACLLLLAGLGRGHSRRAWEW